MVNLNRPAGGIVSGRKEKAMEKNISIQDIEEMTEQDIRTAYAPNFEAVPVKGYTVYLVDVAGRFGYSMIVFGDGRQIVWANDYELHHDFYMKSHTRADLRELYIKKANSQLYTEEELAQPLKDYHDFERRRRYISELLPLKRDFVSIFCFCATVKEKEERKKELKAHPVACHSALGYFTEADKEFAMHIDDLMVDLVTHLENTKNDYDYNFTAFYYELGNHEYHINTYQGDWDTLSAFGQIPWRGQGAEARAQYYKDLSFTETQVKAFEDARKKFLKDAGENDWY